MALGIFIGGIFLGFSLGFATMALVAARGLRFQTEKAQEMGVCPACALSPVRKLGPARQARPQVAGVLVAPRL